MGVSRKILETEVAAAYNGVFGESGFGTAGIAPVSLLDGAGDGTRTHDVQLGKLGKYCQ